MLNSVQHPHPIQSYISAALTAMNTDGPFAWSVFVQLLHHQKQLWLSLSGCLFTSKCVRFCIKVKLLTRYNWCCL